MPKIQTVEVNEVPDDDCEKCLKWFRWMPPVKNQTPTCIRFNVVLIKDKSGKYMRCWDCRESTV